MKKGLLCLMIIALSVFGGFAFTPWQNAEITIHNPAVPRSGGLTLDLEEDFVLGSESDENYLFYTVWDVQADSRRNIYVLDSGAPRIQKYDKNGKYLQTIGRQGQGPGEFEQPIMLTFDKDDNLCVGEMANLPKHRPFFDRIRMDDEGRIYVRQH
jgi:hypothetical protein